MDGVVDATDRDTFVEEILGTVYGDANVDGVFNHDDLVDLFAASEYEDGVAGNSGWRTGDFNGDKEFDSQDIVFIFSRGGYTLIPALPGPESAHRSSIAAARANDSRKQADDPLPDDERDLKVHRQLREVFHD